MQSELVRLHLFASRSSLFAPPLQGAEQIKKTYSQKGAAWQVQTAPFVCSKYSKTTAHRSGAWLSLFSCRRKDWAVGDILRLQICGRRSLGSFAPVLFAMKLLARRRNGWKRNYSAGKKSFWLILGGGYAIINYKYNGVCTLRLSDREGRTQHRLIDNFLWNLHSKL